MKRRRIRWLEPASLDLIEIVEFVRSDRPEAASRLGREILRAAARIARQPLSGRVIPELQEQGISDYRQTLVSPYRVIYAVRDQTIDIVAVIDSRRDLDAALFQRFLQ